MSLGMVFALVVYSVHWVRNTLPDFRPWHHKTILFLCNSSKEARMQGMCKLSLPCGSFMLLLL
jgi:hypothetical protein